LETEEAGSYAVNRAKLRGVAERLKRETDIDIDQLIPLIEEASAAYKLCKDRVDTVESFLKEHLPQDAAPPV
jgi:exodeoxyribonuclease VII small subunit